MEDWRSGKNRNVTYFYLESNTPDTPKKTCFYLKKDIDMKFYDVFFADLQKSVKVYTLELSMIC